MMTIKLTTVGNSTGVVLPKEVLEKLRVSKGDVLHLVETPTGIELTPYDPEFAEQLAVARRHRHWHAERYGFVESNVEFREGFIEDLRAVGMADESVDVVVSNCVVNLSPDKPRVLREVFRVLKPGGELYFSDVFADRRVPAELQTDPVLLGECLAGALYHEDFRRMLAAAGCLDARVVTSTPIALRDPAIERRIGMVTFRSRTGKILANVRAAVGVMLDPPEFDVEFNLDGVHEHRKVSAINVSNNRFGNDSLLYADSVTGGHLGFYVAEPLRTAGVARLAFDILRGRFRENTAVTEMTGGAVDLHFPKIDRAVNCVIDGELLPMDRDVSLRIHAGELKVIVPKVATQSSPKPQAAA